MNLNFYPFDLDMHASVLFDLLLARKHSISHETSPSFEDHIAFCAQHPYREWYIVELDKIIIGSFYLSKQNNIGINISTDNDALYREIIQFITNKFEPLPPVASVIPAHFVINVPPSNASLQIAVEALSGKLIQRTYQL